MIRKIGLFLRGVIPLVLALLAMIGLPTLIVWAIFGGPFSLQYMLIGLLVGIFLFALAGLIFGWALGRYRKRR